MWAVRSLYNRSQSLVPIAGSKFDLFLVRVGQGCPLSAILFKLWTEFQDAGKVLIGLGLCSLQMMWSYWLHQLMTSIHAGSVDSQV